MPAPLKVFQAHLGFFDTVVAVPSRAAALRAWGSRQNLFRDGQARPASDTNAITAALAKPGVVLRRPIGSSGPFSENPGLPQIAKAPRKSVEKKKPAQKPSPRAAQPKGAVPIARGARAPAQAAPPPRPPVDRSALDAAEKALADLKREEERVLAALAKRKAALDEEELRTRNAFHARRKRAEEELGKARKEYVNKLSGR
jgi:hypothetical protein